MGRKFACALLGGTSVLAAIPAFAQETPPTVLPGAQAQEAPPQNAIIVTGSRVIRNGDNSPTPVTVLTTEALQASKPTTIYDALLEQPIFAASRGGRVSGNTGQGANNNSISSLNLRGLGTVRGLVLYDGHRVPPQNLDGGTDLQQIPSLLLQRVDVQTGGSSAVYGSDAMTGVVNFITDRTFVGIKGEVSAGISEYGDAESYEAGVAWGTDLFGGAGHFQASAQYRNEAGLLRTDRPNVQPVGRTSWAMVGNGCPAGTPANQCVPFFLSNQQVDGNGSFGGLINQVTGQPAFLTGPGRTNWYRTNFTTNGVATPFVDGTPLFPGSSQQIGGQGGYASQGTSLATDQDFAQIYGRFDFDITDNLHFYLTGFYNLQNQFNFNSNVRANGSGASNALANGFRLTPDNAFLPDPIQADMRARGITVFQLGKYFDTAFVDAANTTFEIKNRYINGGLEGQFGDFGWELSVTDSKVIQANTSNQSWDTARLFAALDSVELPNGTAACRVTTLPQFAPLYPGCVPFNPFGPDTVTQEMLDYVRAPTNYVGTADLTDVLFTVAGPLFDLWAGEVRGGVTAEWRKFTYGFTSEAEPANVIALDCNALGIPATRTSCVQQTRNAAGQITNAGTTLFYPNGSAGRPPVSQEVKEIAGELDIPLISDWAIFQDLSLNLAARYADYESRGNAVITDPYVTRTFNATTWKAGVNWDVTDDIRLRGTVSRDFRAPNFAELFLPGRIQANGGNDLLTGARNGETIISGATYLNSGAVGGNPDLQPEVGHTITAGIVATPAPGLSMALDFYDITIDDAILTIDGSQSTYQNACYDSGGSSPFCALQQRPGGFTRTPANQALTNSATVFFTSVPFNIGTVRTNGLDFETNYATDLGGRPFTARVLATWQPTLKTVAVGAPSTDGAGVTIPKYRVQLSLGWTLTDALKVNWSTRWRSSLKNVDPLLGLQVAPGNNEVESAMFSNATVSYRFTPEIEAYFNVQNVFDKKPPIYAPAGGGGGIFGMVAGGGGVGFYPADDAIGRYFILGARARF